jgi:hypothetical protein
MGHEGNELQASFVYLRALGGSGVCLTLLSAGARKDIALTATMPCFTACGLAANFEAYNHVLSSEPWSGLIHPGSSLSS